LLRLFLTLLSFAGGATCIGYARVPPEGSVY
jgi:hypothetical protein